MPRSEQIEIQNINCPGRTYRVDAQKYTAMRAVLLKVIPRTVPGITQKEMHRAILPYLPADLWPDGARSAWWAKTVQLDLEAKKLVVRTDSKPLTWHRT